MQHIQQGVDDSGLKYVRNVVSKESGLLIIALHGYGKCLTHLFDSFLDVDESLPIIAVQAPHRLGPAAYRWFGYQPGSSTDILDHERLHSLQRLVAFIEGVSHAEPGRELCLVGHSQGAMIALDAALTCPDVVSGCVCINGRLLSQTDSRLASANAISLAATRFLFAHGHHDSVVPLHMGQAAADRVERAAARVTLRIHPSGHEMDPAVIGDVIAWLNDSFSDGHPNKALHGAFASSQETIHENP